MLIRGNCNAEQIKYTGVMIEIGDHGAMCMFPVLYIKGDFESIYKDAYLNLVGENGNKHSM